MSFVRGMFRLAAVGVSAGIFLAACIVENNNPPPPAQGQGGGSGGNGCAGSCGSPSPMLVDVDTGATMTANPGDGAGVFVEYATGGHWHVWWTCDTNKTGQSCAFDVQVTPSSGALASPTAEGFATGDTLNTTGSVPLEATTTTTTGVAGVHFDTTPGATVTLDAAIGGIRSGQFLFFVQKGQINGGFTGTLTDPLMLEGSSP